MTSRLVAVNRRLRTELWEIEPGICALLPMILDHYPSKLKKALMTRRLATLSGECKCGAKFDKDLNQVKEHEDGEYIHEMSHENWCEATDENLKALGNKYAGRL